MNKVYDIIFCGSGPINLLQAIAAKKQGQEVLIIEREIEIGGAWKSFNYDSEQFEIGCHIMDRHLKVHEFIRNNMGVEMKPLAPGPKVYSKGKYIPYDYKNNVFFVQNKIKKLKSLSISSFFWDSENLSPFKLIPGKYDYPKGGSSLFMQKLYTEIERLNIEIKYRAYISSINLSTDKNYVKLKDGTAIESKKIVMTPFTHIDHLTCNKNEIEINYSERLFRHILIKSSRKFNKPLSYIRIMSDNIMHRISVQSTSTKSHFYLIGINDNPFTQKEAELLIPGIHSTLTKMNLLSDQVIEVKKDFKYPVQYISGEQANKLRSIEGLQVNHSTNLIYSMHFHWDEIKDAF